jgi:hypothetical protein
MLTRVLERWRIRRKRLPANKGDTGRKISIIQAGTGSNWPQPTIQARIDAGIPDFKKSLAPMNRLPNLFSCVILYCGG